MDIVSEIKKFVEEECKKPTAVYDFEIIKYHFIPVVKHALTLAEQRGADKEIVELSAWLHDIGGVIYGRENHHATGAEVAEKKLKELNYPDDKINKIKDCIFSHRGSQVINRTSEEAKILAEADAMSHFDALPGLFRAFFVCEKKDGQGRAGQEVKQKLINSYNKLSEDAKEIIKPKFDAAMLLLNNLE